MDAVLVLGKTLLVASAANNDSDLSSGTAGRGFDVGLVLDSVSDSVDQDSDRPLHHIGSDESIRAPTPFHRRDLPDPYVLSKAI